MATAPTGRAAKKTERQPKLLTSSPPTMGPLMEPVPMIVMYMPMALPLSLSGKASVTIAMLLPWIAAAPAPCTSFAAMRMR